MTVSQQPGSVAAADEEVEFSAPLLPGGLLLDSKYRIVRAIGRGGVGQVYEARQVSLDRRVAIKVLRPRALRSPAARKRFEREARAMARIESEHVATIFDFGIGPEDQPYLVMEYLAGHDLRSLLAEDGVVPAPRAARLMYGACRGVAAAHLQGVIHRDLKPENLFVVHRDDRELCKVLDFGLAKLRANIRSEMATRTGIPLGTLHYMSPEQARGDADIDERADIYGCAAVMYELLTGRRPHVAESAHSLLYKIVHETPKRVDELFPFIPDGLASVVQSGLARDRRERPESIHAFAALLEPFIASGGVPPSCSATLSEPASDPNRVSLKAASPTATQLTAWNRAAVALLVGAMLGSVAGWRFAAPRSNAEKVNTSSRHAAVAAPTALSPGPRIGPDEAASPATSSLAKPSPATSSLATSSLAKPSLQSSAVPASSMKRKPLPVSANRADPRQDVFERRNPYD